MKLINEYKKTALIILFVLACGMILQISRSQFVLETTKNNTEPLAHVTSLNDSPMETLQNAEYCILYDDSSLAIKQNVEMTLRYMKKLYRTFNVALGGIPFQHCPALLHTTGELEHIGTIEQIENYVAQGGHLFLLRTLEPTSHFNVLYAQLGILHHNFFTETTGIEMRTNLMIGAAEQTLLNDTLNDSSLNIVLHDNIPVHMASINNNPLVWQQPYKKGSFIVMNTNLLAEKNSRGLLPGLLALAKQPFIYPIFNTKTFYLDDFPAPLPSGTHAIIYDEYKKTTDDFFKTIWWPNMLKIASKYDIRYTGALIQTYEDHVTAPFLLNDVEANNVLMRFGRELIQHGGELGYHGYNHQSLTLDASISKTFGYNAWPRKDEMKLALQELDRYTKQALPAYDITSYVPPSNVLSITGREALQESIPTLVTINSLYIEDATERSYIQEFDIGADGIINMPRISSGYFERDEDTWNIYSIASLHGVFSHFIHPDDVISDDRSNGSWSEMYAQFEQYMAKFKQTYPWLRAMTATNAAYALANTLQSEPTFQYDEHAMKGTIQNFREPQYFILRLPKKIKQTDNCTIEKIDKDVYLVTATDASFTIRY